MQPRLAAAGVPTLEAASEALGVLPEGASIHLDRGGYVKFVVKVTKWPSS